MTSSESSWRYLRQYLTPLQPVLARADVTDIYVNRPAEIWVETLDGRIERHDTPDLTPSVLERLARQIAAWSHQGINREHPLLSAALPDGARIQIVAPPATHQHWALAIRKHVSADLSLTDYTSAGAFKETVVDRQNAAGDDASIAELLARNDIPSALRTAVHARRNILISGGTSTGKTTFLNALLKEIASDERLVTIEDTPELRVPHANAVSLFAARGALGEARVTADDLVSASLRLRPDRIILGELRGTEAYAFLRAINSGHPGSLTTIHADSTHGAVEQLALLILQGGNRLSRQDIIEYIRATVGVFVQLGRRGGRRYVAEVRQRW